METGATDRLIERCQGIRFADVPAEALRVARQALLDWSAVGLAGSREPLVAILCRQLLPGSPGGSSLVGRGERIGLLEAALINGAASHALDYDDTHNAMMGHPSVPVVPALLALAERDGRSGRDFLAAFVAGVEAECCLGELLDFSHYEVGFHSTGTLGTFGAAAAAAHLLGLDRSGWRNALGLAGTQAAGLKSGFGTMAKPLHAGRAASNGLLAALLAQDGFTAQPAILEVAQGFAATHHGGTIDAARLDRHPEHLRIRDTLFKYHAACYLTHAPIEAALRAVAVLGIDAGEVDAVTVRVARPCLDVCNIERPQTGLEAKFSLRATVAMALAGIDTSDLGSYRDDLVQGAAFVALRDRIRVEAREDRQSMRATVAVSTTDGRHEELSFDTAIPAEDLDAQEARLRAKFDALAIPVLGELRAKALADAIGSLETTSSMASFGSLLVER